MGTKGMNATFTNGPSSHSLRAQWLMEQRQKQEIGERIKELRENSAETNRSIADYCDVGERSVAAWVAGEGIAYENAQKVAELFKVDVDYIWRGGTSSSGAVLGFREEDVARSIRTEAKLDAVLQHLGVDYLTETAPQGDQLGAKLSKAKAAAAKARPAPRQSKPRSRKGRS